MKKTIKTLLNLFVLFVFALVLVGCGDQEDEVTEINGKTVEEIYASAKQEVAECKAYVIQGTLVENMEFQGQNVTYSMDMVQMMKDDMFYSKSSSASAELASMNSEMWATADTVYMISSGMNMKINMNMKDLVEALGLSFYSDSLLLDLESGFFTGAKFTLNGDNYEIKVSLDAAKYLSELKDSALGSILSALSDDSIKKFDFTVAVDKDGNLKGVNQNIDIEMTTMGVTIKMNVDTNYTFSKGCDNMPSLPAGCEEWTDYTDFIGK